MNEVSVVDERFPIGSANLELVAGVRAIHEEDVVFRAMLNGWQSQMIGGRNLRPKTVSQRVNCIKRFVGYTNEYPWRWNAQMVDEWMTALKSEERKLPSTLRNYQEAIRLFCDYITSPYYSWPSECMTRFDTHPVQVCHEWNTISHLVDYEGDPRRRPMTRDEVQILFDYADEEVGRVLRRRRKGALAAYRDATIFKVLYGWGLRCNEVRMLDCVDLRKNVAAPEFGRYGLISVRFGKSNKGAPPKRREVASLMPWAVEALEDYVVNARPLWQQPDNSALWPTERGGRIRVEDIEGRFARYRDELKMPAALTPHCLRHSYTTHSIEDGVDPKFLQEQLGHAYASTTALYTSVSGDFMNTMMRKAVDAAFFKEGDAGDTET